MLKSSLLFTGKYFKNSCDKKYKIFKMLCLDKFEYIENSQAIFMSLYKKQINFNAYAIQEFVIIKNECL